jgi:poly(3-hydroxybutyrate) depolymerase
MNPKLLWSCVGFALGFGSLGVSASLANAVETGFQAEVRVKAPTRLDWEFAASSLSPNVWLAADYDACKQRYQLYVPKEYKPDRAWPLLVYIAPGDDPEGWRHWPMLCEEQGLLFCAAYGGGNSCPAVERTHLVLDMFDDVRRQYRIDPDQTYLAGFSGGAPVACAIGFALPEYFGGILAVSGAGPLNRLAYLRHRAQDRLSVALVTGSKDPHRQELEEYTDPYLHDMGIRTRLWAVPGLGHALPGVEVLAEARAWLGNDLRRRQADTQARPTPAGNMPTPSRQAARLVERAEVELRQPDKTWRAVALLQGVLARWEEEAPAATARARQLLEAIKADPLKARWVAEQGGAEERRGFVAQATALERVGRPAEALRAWNQLAKLHPDTTEGKRAADEAQRLVRQRDEARALAQKQPFLGLAFQDDTTTVLQVAAKGPADRAGIKPGDVVVRFGTVKVSALAVLLEELKTQTPGKRVSVEVLRAGKPLQVLVELTARPGSNGP